MKNTLKSFCNPVTIAILSFVIGFIIMDNYMKNNPIEPNPVSSSTVDNIEITIVDSNGNILKTDTIVY